MDGSDNKQRKSKLKDVVHKHPAFAFKACLSVHMFPQNRNEQK